MAGSKLENWEYDTGLVVIYCSVLPGSGRGLVRVKLKVKEESVGADQSEIVDIIREFQSLYEGIGAHTVEGTNEEKVTYVFGHSDPKATAPKLNAILHQAVTDYFSRREQVSLLAPRFFVACLKSFANELEEGEGLGVFAEGNFGADNLSRFRTMQASEIARVSNESCILIRSLYEELEAGDLSEIDVPELLKALKEKAQSITATLPFDPETDPAVIIVGHILNYAFGINSGITSFLRQQEIEKSNQLLADLKDLVCLNAGEMDSAKGFLEEKRKSFDTKASKAEIRLKGSGKKRKDSVVKTAVDNRLKETAIRSFLELEELDTCTNGVVFLVYLLLDHNGQVKSGLLDKSGEEILNAGKTVFSLAQESLSKALKQKRARAEDEQKASEPEVVTEQLEDVPSVANPDVVEEVVGKDPSLAAEESEVSTAADKVPEEKAEDPVIEDDGVSLPPEDDAREEVAENIEVEQEQDRFDAIANALEEMAAKVRSGEFFKDGLDQKSLDFLKGAKVLGIEKKDAHALLLTHATGRIPEVNDSFLAALKQAKSLFGSGKKPTREQTDAARSVLDFVTGMKQTPARLLGRAIARAFEKSSPGRG